jgi:putative transposase
MQEVDRFSEKWDAKYPMISRSWRSRWVEIVPFFKFPDQIRKVIYTTNAIESVNFTIRKVTKNRQSFPNTEAAEKLVFMALQNISKK